MKGRLIVFEGADGVGKSTVAKVILNKCISKGIPSILKTFPGKEAGTLGLLVNKVHHSPELFNINRIDPTSLQLLHIAAHIDLIGNEIKPEYEKGKIIILDRFWWSTYVYGIVNGGDKETIAKMIELERTFWGDIQPKTLFLFNKDEPFNTQMDILKWRLIKSAYLELAEKERHNYPVEIVSASQSIEAIQNVIIDNIIGSN